MSLAAVPRQKELRRRAEQHNKKIEDIFAHAKELREAQLRELGCSVDPSDEGMSGGFDEDSNGPAGPAREGKVSKFLFKALKSQNTFEESEIQRETEQSVDIEMRIPAVANDE